MEEIVIAGRSYWISWQDKEFVSVGGEFYSSKHRLLPGLLGKLSDELADRGIPVTTDHSDFGSHGYAYELRDNGVTFRLSRGVAGRMIERALRVELAKDPDIPELVRKAEQISRCYFLALYVGLNPDRSKWHYHPIQAIEKAFHEKTEALWEKFEHPYKYLFVDREIGWKPPLNYGSCEYRGGDISVTGEDLVWLYQRFYDLEDRLDKLVPGKMAKDVLS